ncbi:MAG TPA: methyltransferase domain-containing protein [Actinomycetota bacterium]|nr:methyltransferase domain-containing protein [Actinomycetota bacterium]
MTDVHARIREFWDRDAATYDLSASHAVSDPLEATAWRAALRRSLPDPPATVLDAGAGTGSLSLLAAELGHRVTSLDLSEAMLSKARDKAEARGLELTFEVGSAMTPPAGPFMAVMERHVLWTMTDPVGALSAWRDVTAPRGRLVMFEGVWGSTTPVHRARRIAAAAVRRATGVADHHHAPYPDDVLAALPLARMPSPSPVVAAVYDAGWSGVRIQRLRDVEWAARLHERWPLGWLEHVPRYALIADRG